MVATKSTQKSTAMDYLTAPGKPGATVLLVVEVPRSHAK